MKIGLAVSAGLLVLLALFAPKIRRTYLSAREKMHAATEKRRASKRNNQ